METPPAQKSARKDSFRQQGALICLYQIDSLKRHLGAEAQQDVFFFKKKYFKKTLQLRLAEVLKGNHMLSGFFFFFY